MQSFQQRSKMRNSGGLFLALLLSTGMAAGQATPTQEKTPDQQSAPTQTGSPAPAAAQPAAKESPKEEQRQAKLLADTNHLYELVQQLKAEVAKSSKDTLSLEVVKKAAEVEKLAKSLKERMRSE